jgi:hypothetical protein
MNKISLDDIKISLQKLLVAELFSNIENQTAILKENDTCTKLSEVKIIGVPDDSIFIKIDYGDEYKMFRSENGQRRRCDYLIIADKNKNNKNDSNRILLFIEMKSTNFQRNEIDEKFRASECLLDYIVSMLKRFHNINLEPDQCKKRFVVFHNKRIDKTPIHPPKEIGSKPENYLSVNFYPDKPPTLKSLS